MYRATFQFSPFFHMWDADFRSSKGSSPLRLLPKAACAAAVVR
jgi:hypothetical protein